MNLPLHYQVAIVLFSITIIASIVALHETLTTKKPVRKNYGKIKL